jgi:hypothetical protein
MVTPNSTAACAECEALATAPIAETRQTYPHLRCFFVYEQDEFVSGTWHYCPACERLWHEVNSTYNGDWGWHWAGETWAEFLRRHSDELPPNIESTPTGLKRWLADFDGPLYAGYLGR